jgi:hypothetical protein
MVMLKPFSGILTKTLEQDKVILVGDSGSLFFLDSSFDETYLLLTIVKDPTNVSSLLVTVRQVET